MQDLCRKSAQISRNDKPSADNSSAYFVKKYDVGIIPIVTGRYQQDNR